MLLPAIPLLAVIGMFVALGIAVTARPLSQGFVSWLQNAGRVAQFFGGITADIAVKLTRWITHHVGAEWHDLERLGVTWLSGLYQWADLAITNALEWPLWLWRFQRWLLFHEIPRIIHAIPHLATSVTHTITKRVKTVERTIVKLPRLSKAAAKALVSAAVATYIHPFLADLQWLRRHFHAITAVLPRVIHIPHVPTFPNIWKRIRSLEKRLAVPLGIAAVIAAIGRLGIGWVRCNKVKRLGKRTCGFDDSWIGSFIADALLVTSALSIVELARDLQTLTPAVADGLGYFVREAPAGFHAITDAERIAANSIAGVADSIINRL